MRKGKAQVQVCDDQHGYANPLPLVIACKCDRCDGELLADGINAMGALGILICTVCRCTYAIAATKEISR